MGFLPSCSYVSSVIWLHHLDFNKTPWEKGRWELYKDSACCFEQILDKTAAVQSYLPYKPRRTCWALRYKEELWTHLKKLILSSFADTVFYLEDLPRLIVKRERERERESFKWLIQKFYTSLSKFLILLRKVLISLFSQLWI